MNTTPDKLTRKQEQAIAILLTSSTLLKAAQTIGVSVDTLSRWMKQEVFAEAYRNARQQVVKQVTSRLSQTAEDAVRILHEIAASPRSVTQARVAAARIIIDQTLKAYELEDLSVRIKRTEETLEEITEMEKANR